MAERAAHGSEPRFSRRQILKHTAGAGMTLALGLKPRPVASATKQSIEHIVVVMMENLPRGRVAPQKETVA
jgi:phospholipase C